MSYFDKKGPLHENIARFYFDQLIDAVKQIHAKKVAHLDLNLQNLMLDSDYNLNLIDFGLSHTAESIHDNLENKVSYERNGTRGFQPPEMIERTGYKLVDVDLFSSGVILFVMVIGRLPFQEAKAGDSMYQKIIDNQWDTFWNIHLYDGKVECSLAFKDLIEQMLSYRPNERLTLEQIIDHPFLNGKEYPPLTEVQAVMSTRKSKQFFLT